MRRSLRRVVGALVGAAMLITPATALADSKPGQKFCPTYKQVESDATGGQYVAGILIYETMGTVTRTGEVQSTTVSSSGETEVGLEKVLATSTTTTVSVTSTDPTMTISAEEPIGYYSMNDGSVYQVNCVTGQYEQVG